MNVQAGPLTSITCLREELMVATTGGFILRIRWDGSQNRDYSLDLRRVPFCTDQQVSKGEILHPKIAYFVQETFF